MLQPTGIYWREPSARRLKGLPFKVCRHELSEAFKCDLLLVLFQLDRSRINAITQACRLRSVLEDMTQVPAATGARDFDAAHAVAAIIVFFNDLLICRSIKTGPAAMRV